MSQVPFKHPECNGWAIFDSSNIDAENPKNMHIAEVGIKRDDKGKLRVAYINNDSETICEKKLIRNPESSFCSISASEIRSVVAGLQNKGYEICGTCVSHFYADQE